MVVTPEKRLRTTIGTALGVLGFAVAGTWGASAYFNAIDSRNQRVELRMERMQDVLTEQIQQLRSEVAAQGRRAWLAEEQYRWVSALEREFRRSEFTIPPADKYRSAP